MACQRRSHFTWDLKGKKEPIMGRNGQRTFQAEGLRRTMALTQAKTKGIEIWAVWIKHKKRKTSCYKTLESWSQARFWRNFMAKVKTSAYFQAFPILLGLLKTLHF